MSFLCDLFFKEDHDLEPCEAGSCHVLIVALDYDYSPGDELTCTTDAAFFMQIAAGAGVEDITIVTDKDKLGTPKFPTRKEVIRHIKKVGQRCQPDDWFIWFFAGHGVNVPDVDGDEADGFDEAFVTPSEKGKLTDKAVLVDDDFVRVLQEYVPRQTKILCICDCCHSGTICDVDSFSWEGRCIYQISASQDHEEAEDTGKGGVLTQALKRIIRTSTFKFGNRPFSLQRVADGCVEGVHQRTKEQECSFQYSGTDPALVAWPLPLRRRDFVASQISSGKLEDYEDKD
eukprot:TRINITY_DN67916_c0_g1_i1.p1 TRINITY_DN67916_c0_g1~~TRINITY_DN67916_c0_g1_i1.p1  ORF type:complete len:287 (+),score=57.88 TRINITY_DN67916_c0_g1_i1:61-921(+)